MEAGNKKWGRKSRVRKRYCTYEIPKVWNIQQALVFSELDKWCEFTIVEAKQKYNIKRSKSGLYTEYQKRAWAIRAVKNEKHDLIDKAKKKHNFFLKHKKLSKWAKSPSNSAKEFGQSFQKQNTKSEQ